jgi:glycogen phosphorylase
MSDNGVPHDWVKVMKATMKSNAAHFSARRMFKEYISKFYSKSIQKTMEEDNGPIQSGAHL